VDGIGPQSKSNRGVATGVKETGDSSRGDKVEVVDDEDDDGVLTLATTGAVVVVVVVTAVHAEAETGMDCWLPY